MSFEFQEKFSHFCLRIIPTCYSESQSSEAFNSVFLTHADEYRTESAQMSNDL